MSNYDIMRDYDIIHYPPFNPSHDIMYDIMTMIYKMRSYMISWGTKTTKIPDDSKSGLQRKCDSESYCQRNLYFKTKTLRLNPKLSLALQPDVSHGDRDPASVSQSRRRSESVTVTGSTP